ncbi:MAG: hypothetical protein JF588_08980 [Caulobacterales bacterium]|nr:hypothetical protein [Caulobacterales bacterium]
MPTSLPVQLLALFATVSIAFALWKGGSAERLAAACVAANLGSSILLNELLGQVDGVIRFASDGLTALALLAVTLRYAAPWMIGVMLLYSVQFALHAYYMVVGRNDRDYLHALINNIDFTGVAICLAAGTAMAWQGRQRTRDPAPL